VDVFIISSRDCHDSNSSLSCVRNKVREFIIACTVPGRSSRNKTEIILQLFTQTFEVVITLFYISLHFSIHNL
jgi:hypothetical protein